MKKKLWLVVAALVLVTMAACGKEDAVKKDVTEVSLPLEVALSVEENIKVDSMVEMKAVVTQGEEKVEDADKVEFEVWEEGKKDDSVIIKAVNDKNGLYIAETMFDHDGQFHVQVHVSARSLHTMPKKEVTVGNGGNYEEATEDEQVSVTGFSMDFMKPKNMKSDEATELVVQLKVDGEPFPKARVRYEIWNKAKPDNHDWIDTKESVVGEYTASHTFVESGMHKIQIHVTDEEGLHEHEVYELEIK